MIDDFGEEFNFVPADKPKHSNTQRFSESRPTLTVQLSAAHEGKVWYNNVEMECVQSIAITANADDLTEVTLVFRGVNINKEIVSASDVNVDVRLVK